MNEEYNKVQIDKEIDFIQLFIAIWKNKIWVLCITLIITILVGLYSGLNSPTIYNSSMSILINMPNTYATIYGDYNLPVKDNLQYISYITSDAVLSQTIKDMKYDNKVVTIDSLRSMISINNNAASGSQQNYYDVKVTADRAEEAVAISSALYNNYIDYMKVMLLENIVELYTKQLETQNKQLEKDQTNKISLIEDYEKILKTISQTIDYNYALDDIYNKTGLSNVVVLGNISNPTYTKVESDIITVKQTIQLNENIIENNNNLLNQLKEEKEALDNYYEKGVLNSEVISSSIIDTSISKPSTVNQVFAPSIKSSIIKGALIGIIIGCLFALLKFYLPFFVRFIKQINNDKTTYYRNKEE